MPETQNTIGTWTPGQLVRFVQNMLREHPPQSSDTFQADTITAVKTLNCKDQIQLLNFQTGVGLAGSATALPANPRGYFRFLDYTGTVVVVPYYNAS